MSDNRLYYGDNLQVLRDDIVDETVDLIYLDPPFNSNATYNVLFRAPGGEQSQAQIEAFEDTWHWTDEAQRAFDDVMASGNTSAADMLRAMRSFLGENDMMAYLAMMAVRLLELHRVLKPTGSLYLHCDPTASHYLKILLDAIFGAKNFRNEIVWKRTSSHSNVGKKYGVINENLLFYTKSSSYTWNPQHVNYSEEHINRSYRFIEAASGRRYASRDLTASMQRASSGQLYEWKGIRPPSSRCWAYAKEQMKKFEAEGRIVYSQKGYPRLKVYLDEMPGVPLQNIWLDVPVIAAQSAERLGYPTQKPVALLERIIQASSNEGDWVLDPFCGCGTTIHAAEKLKRHWIGIDITHLAISLIEKRLKDAFPGVKYDVYGTPKDLDGAKALAAANKYQFQWWAVSLVNAHPYGGKKKGADTGIDGVIYFKPDGKRTERAVVSVKGGERVSVGMVRDLRAVLDREKAPIGVFITLVNPTRQMIAEAASAGHYETESFRKVPRIQILTLADLFNGKKPQIPFIDPAMFKKAPRVDTSRQEKLL